ncbi:alkaline-phosphatase-like protein [Sporodiniella umbellata]|nr:alkaline-phosphatase-like protein [Sporodiniella umbellata]
MQSNSVNEESFELVTSSGLVQEQDHLLKDDSSSEEEEEEEEEEYIIPVESILGWTKCQQVTIAVLAFICIILLIILSIIKVANSPLRSRDWLYLNGTHSFASTVILISLDGFRPDFLERNLTPHINRLSNNGIKAKYIHPAFPPTAYPNHWTLMTGLYPETHGIVGNDFYDPVLGKFESTNQSVTSDDRWWKGEPIWSTLKKNEQKTASIMWPGSNTKHNAPDYVSFNDSESVMEKVQTTLSWIDLPDNERPQLISVHVPQADQKKNPTNIKSKAIRNHIKQSDDAIGFLLKGLEERNIESHVHVVIVSGHGVSPTNKHRVIYYEDILPRHLLKYVLNASPSSGIYLQNELPQDVIQDIYRHLSNQAQSHHFKVYLKQEMPERYHYRRSDRISPIQVIPDTGYIFASHKTRLNDIDSYCGYDNLDDDMRAIFIANGPKVRGSYVEGSILAPFFNIELYEFLTGLLNIDASPNNGTLKGDFPIIYKPIF